MAHNKRDLINALSESLSFGDVLAAEQLARISAMIVKARIDRKMTQKEFASMLGVSQSMVSKWESEYYNFSIESLANICSKLGWDLNVEIRPHSSSEYSKLHNYTNSNWATKAVSGNNAGRIGVAS